MSTLKILLVSTNIEIYEEWVEEFRMFPNVKPVLKHFQSIENYDCITSPANSYGIMDGGMDAHIIDYFGKDLEKRVQQHIIDNYSGEQPIGTSFIIETNNPKHPFLAHSPTMSVPDIIDGTSNVYYATKATLEAVKIHNRNNKKKIKTLLLPAFGGGTGDMESNVLAQQMRLAYFHFINPPKLVNWSLAHAKNREINSIL